MARLREFDEEKALDAAMQLFGRRDTQLLH